MNDTLSPQAGAPAPQDCPSPLAHDAAADLAEALAPQADHGIGALLCQIEELQAQVQQHKEAHLRLLADLDNLRKRTVREKDDLRRQAHANLMEALLPVLDHFKLGLQSAQAAGSSSLHQGFALIHDQFEQVLMAHGLHTLSPQMGQAFDPNQHECLAHTEHASVPEGGIIETLRRGYRLYDKLLRPCSVLVSKGPAQTSDTPATAPSSAPGSTNS